jgi:sRNA-binding protein
VTKRDSQQFPLILQVLQTHYPKAFDRKHPLPLAIGTNKRLRKEFPEITERLVHRFLCWWCRRWEYMLACVQDGAVRFHVSGRKSKEITEEEKIYFLKKMSRAKLPHPRRKRKKMKSKVCV